MCWKAKQNRKEIHFSGKIRWGMIINRRVIFIKRRMTDTQKS